MGRGRGSRDWRFTERRRIYLGIFVVAVAVLGFTSRELQIGFGATAAFFFYLLLIAPIRCNNPKSGNRRPCINNGWGFLVGCRSHQLDTIRRIFGRDPHQVRSGPQQRGNRAGGPVQTARSGGIPASSVAAVTTRRKIFDAMNFLVAVLSMTAGWLALVIDPGK